MYYGGYGYYDDDWMWGMAVGTTMVVAASAASDDDDDDETTVINTTTTTSTGATLPCNPTVTTFEGMTYYQCGEQHYVLAYGGAGPIYMPVPPPGVTAGPAAAAADATAPQ